MRKSNVIVSIVFILIGTNVFTYATARYLTTSIVLSRAEQRTESALRDRLRDQGIPEQVFQNNRQAKIGYAIRSAGGMYYWWNTALAYWGIGILLTVTGLAVPFVRSRLPGK
ncbi:MAG: hypothetical protein CMJ49_01205 [Planctomycetaceae bacterium]|nr:hypothetical protein [Planctomycetaceae bacterium]